MKILVCVNYETKQSENWNKLMMRW